MRGRVCGLAVGVCKRNYEALLAKLSRLCRLIRKGATMIDHMTIQRSEFGVSDFLTWQRANELDLSPSFQRRSVWSKKAKSFFIDTILRGLPIPIVFLREKTDIEKMTTKREVIDGQQRLRTLLSFIDPQSLPDFDPNIDDFKISRIHNATLAGKAYADLNAEMRKRILSYKITVHILPSDTADRQVLDIFRRMNATGTKLNHQELRNAKWFGDFISSVYEVSYQYLDEWRSWGLFSEMDIARMKEAEFVSELYILCLNGITEQSQTKIEKYYADYDTEFPHRKAVERRVATILKKIDDDFGEQIKESIFANKIWFYPLFAAVLDHFFGLGEPLDKAAVRPLSASIARALSAVNEAYRDPSKLDDATQKLVSGRSNRKANREALKDLILEEF